jgi:leader peptidase (prepilin peptidase)/N-methyltransferase|tara:strand:- start:5509 stop:5970 length:462 start_codon:yes stop_codon:yes gene_type:complete
VAVAALAWLLVGSILLARIDLREQRLPTRWIWALAVGLVVIHGIDVLAGGDGARLGWALVGGLVFGGLLLGLHLASPLSLGGGDVRLAVPLGIQVGWASGDEIATGIAAVTTLAALLTVAGGLIVRRGRLGTGPLPFGPGLLTATLLVTVWSP